MIATISPSLWYAEKAADAARFYASIFPDSRIDRISYSPADTPSGPAGSVEMVEFTLLGRPFFAMAAGKLDPFNHAISFAVDCETQEEIDHYWRALLDGGQEEHCGWLRDRYGVLWQIVPAVLRTMMAAPDRAAAKRAMEAMMTMLKLDIATLRMAFDGR